MQGRLAPMKTISLAPARCNKDGHAVSGNAKLPHCNWTTADMLAASRDGEFFKNADWGAIERAYKSRSRSRDLR